MEAVDDLVDVDAKDGHKPVWHLAHVRDVIAYLHHPGGSKALVRSIVATPYDLDLVACVRLAHHIGRPITGQLAEAWEWYTRDAEWNLAGHRFPSPEIQAASDEAYIIMYATLFYVLGVDYDISLNLSRAFAPLLVRTKALSELPQGIAKHEPKVTAMELEAARVKTDYLAELMDALRASEKQELAWRTLKGYLPFTDWFLAEVDRVAGAWQQTGAPALQKAGSLVAPPFGNLARGVLETRAAQIAGTHQQLGRRFTS
jgi:hypothetical protein